MMSICFIFINNMRMDLEDTDMDTELTIISFIIMLLLVRTVAVEAIMVMAIMPITVVSVR